MITNEIIIKKSRFITHLYNLDNADEVKTIIENLKKEYTGVFYDRYILGLWKSAEGVIYPQFAENPDVFVSETTPDEIAFASIGVDFGGNKSAHAFVCTGFTASMQDMVVLDEFYLKETISPKQLEDCFVSFVSKCKSRISCPSVPPSISNLQTPEVFTPKS